MRFTRLLVTFVVPGFAVLSAPTAWAVPLELVYQTAPAFGNETHLLSYDALTDFVNANSASSTQTTNNFATGGYLAGFTYDGSQYHLIYQTDPVFGNETHVLSYNSLTDFVNANSASSIQTTNNFATGGYLAGFTAVTDFDSRTVPEPASGILLSLGLVALGLTRRRLRRQDR